MKYNLDKQSLILYNKYQDLIFYAYNLLIKFPKSEKYSLANDIKQNIYENLKLILKAWRIKDNIRKLEILEDVDINIFYEKNLIKLAYRLKYITDQNYSVWNNKLNEIGKLIGGWINNIRD